MDTQDMAEAYVALLNWGRAMGYNRSEYRSATTAFNNLNEAEVKCRMLAERFAEDENRKAKASADSGV